MVGDGEQDVLAGRAAGALTVGVRGGIQPVERLLEARPDHLLETLYELPALVTKLGDLAREPVIRGRDLREALRQERLLA